MKLRVSEFRFPTCPLGELVEILDHQRRPVNQAERDKRVGPYPYYGANGQVGTIDDFIFDDELVLVAEDGGFFDDPVRPIAYRVSGKCWINNHAHILRPKSGIDIDWLAFAVGFLDVRDWVNGATIPKLTQRDLRSLPIPVAPLVEQRRIAARVRELMDRVDEVRQLRSESDVLIRRLRAAFRFDQWNGLKELRHEFAPLGDLVSESRNGLYKPSGFHGSGVPLIRMFNIVDGAFDGSRIERLRVDEKELARFGVRHGQLLVSRVNSRDHVGKSAVFPGIGEDAVMEAMLIRLTVDETRANPWFVGAMMSAPQFLDAVRLKAKHAIGQSSISQGDLLSTPIPVPPLSVQMQIAKIAQDWDATVSHMSHSTLEQISLLPPAVLRKAFAGEL